MGSLLLNCDVGGQRLCAALGEPSAEQNRIKL